VLDQRILYGGSDYSSQLGDYRAQSVVIPYEAGEYIYVASYLPFNNLYFDVKVANSESATLSLDMWWGKSWIPAVDLTDKTSALSTSGRVSWNTHRLKGWDCEDTSEDVTGVESFKIYDRFWARISFSADLTAETELNYIGQKFSSDDILFSYYPDLSRTKTLLAFETGKTSWNEQHYMAAEYITSDLKRRDIIESRSQLMEWQLFEAPSCHRVAQIVYTAFGRPYFDQLQEAIKNYKDTMNIKKFGVDLTRDGTLQEIERYRTTSFVTR